MTAGSTDDAALVERAEDLLRSVGQRVTKPRIAVLTRILAAGDQHLSADDLLEQMGDRDAGVHRATVYRTLEGLAEVGVLDHVHLDRGLTAYHLADSVAGRSALPHLHAQCTECGTVVDLPAGVLGDAPARIRKASGFRLDPTHVALSGTCAECFAASR